MAVTIKNSREIAKMREAGHVVSVVHQRIQDAIAPGVTTQDLDDIARDTFAEMGAGSLFLGHHGFTGRICASVNEEIVHGIPGNRVLRDGDIISVDVGATIGGFCGDSAWTYGVGRISDDARRLLQDTEISLLKAIEQARPGNRLGAIGHAVEQYALERGYGLVREYGGHGIGRQMWEDPHVPNHGDPNRGVLLRPGMTLAIEPMLNIGGDETRTLEDGWTVVTQDGTLSAHFEHTVVITRDEPEILTKRLAAVVH
ncbi:MAG: type I methionyl aminopeptidase [Thermomicrobiales bacterium]|nr:type I methionyl aminopeptidase [Thermomicrobiales bacterium]